MKILFVVPAIAFGGAERVISILSNEWGKKGHKLYIISMDDMKRCTYQFASDVEVDFIPPAIFKKKIDIFKTFLNVSKAISKRKPDVVVSFISSTAVFSIPYAFFTRTPLVYSERNDPNQIKEKKAQWFQKMAITFSKHVVFQTKEAQSFYGAKVDKKSSVIPNPFDSNLLPCDRYNGKRKKIIVSVGRLTKQKNQRLLIDAFSKVNLFHPDYELVIYGEGELRSELESKIEQLNLSNKAFLPGIQKDILKSIDGASVFALTSDYEGIPNALIEAMAMGIPCVSTDCSPGGARSLIDNGVNGFLVPCNDITELSDKINYYIENPDIAEQIGQEASKICDTLNPQFIAQQWLDVFERIM